MIPSDLLFQVDPITSVYGFGISAMIITSCIAMVLIVSYVFMKKRSMIPTIGSDLKNYIIPEIDSLDFESEMAHLIRRYIDTPRNLEAYTSHEIRVGKGGHPWLVYLDILEKAQYQGKKLTRSERRMIIDAIRTI